jgi:hypothetical protein
MAAIDKTDQSRTRSFSLFPSQKCLLGGRSQLANRTDESGGGTGVSAIAPIRNA